MTEKTQNIIKKTLKKTFKTYKGVDFSESSRKIVIAFVEEFMHNFNQEVNINKVLKSSKSRESELIGNIEQQVLTSKVCGDSVAIEEIKKMISKFKEKVGE